jgi:hypothetical protein
MSPELASILTRIDLAYDLLLTTTILTHNLHREGTDADRDRITNADVTVLNDMVDRLEELIKREVTT